MFENTQYESLWQLRQMAFRQLRRRGGGHFVRSYEMLKQAELQKLFDLTVKHELNPEDALTSELLKEAKRECLILWPEEARNICRKAVGYAVNVKAGKIVCTFSVVEP